MGASVMVHGNYSAGLEFEFGDADSVFYEEDLFGAALEDFEGAIFIFAGVPVRRGVAERFVFEDLDSYVAERAIGDVARYVGEGGWGESGFAVLELDGYWRLVFHRVDQFGVAQGYVDVVVAVPVHQRFRVRGNFDVEDSDGFIFEGQVMIGLGGDFNFGSWGLGG